MKRYLFLIVICMTTAIFTRAQDYKIVFDLTSQDSVNQITLIRQLNAIRETSPTAKLEVVLYGQGLSLALKDKTPLQPSISKLMENNHVSFKVCEYTMKRNNVDKTQLIPGIETVPDGIYEIYLKQQEGWGYIKVAH